MMTQNAILSISPKDIVVFDDEPRVPDIRLGQSLGFERTRKIRELIESNIAELSNYGTSAPRRGAYRGQPTNEYLLNEAQALLICMFARTARAAEVRKQIIEVFMAWRRGETAPPPPQTGGKIPHLTLAQRLTCSAYLGNWLVHTLKCDHDAAMETSFRLLAPLRPKPDGKQALKPHFPPQKTDDFDAFTAECVIREAGASAGAAALYARYLAWAKREGLRALSEKAFALGMMGHFDKHRRGAGVFYLDCRVKRPQ